MSILRRRQPADGTPIDLPDLRWFDHGGDLYIATYLGEYAGMVTQTPSGSYEALSATGRSLGKYRSVAAAESRLAADMS
jgi:hypothetical protein